MGTAQSVSASEAENTVSGFQESRKASLYFVAVVLLTGVAAALRLYGLGNRGFWLDETFSLDLSHRPFLQLLLSFREGGTNMALYHLLLHFWMKLGDSEAFLRAMSVVFSVATVPFTYLLGARLFGRQAGLVACSLLTVNVFHIYYAQEVRAYALVTLLGTVATYLLVRNIQEPQRATWALYGVFLALTVYTHLLGVLLIVAHGASLLCLPQRAIPWKGLMRSTVWFVACTLPIAVLVLVAKSDPLNWVQKTSGEIVLTYLVLNAGNGGYPLLALDSIAVGASILYASRGWLQKERSPENWAAALAIFWFLLPFLSLLAISAFRPMFVPRYLLIALPGFLLAVSAGLTRMRLPLLAWALGIGISLANLTAVWNYYHLSSVIDDWRAISSSVFDRAEKGDQLFLLPNYAAIPFEYYRMHRRVVPEWPETIEPPEARRGTNRTTGAQAAATSRFWIVFHHPMPLTPQSRHDLTANLNLWNSDGWTLREAHEFPNVIVLFFVVNSPQARPPAALPNLLHPDQPASESR